MPNDDGTEVRIESQVVFRGFDGVWRHYIKVCNHTTVPKDLWVTTWPYGNNGKIGDKTGIRVATLPPSTCQIVMIPISGQPTQYYTDVYEYSALWPGNEGGRYHFNVDSARVVDKYSIYRDVLHPLGTRIRFVGCVLPYPRSLEAGGVRRQFYVRGVHGLPVGWKVRNLWPARGETFALTPDQKEFPCYLELVCGREPREAVTPVTIDVGIRGQPFRPPYRVSVTIPFVRKDRAPVIAELKARRTPERPYLHFTVRATDELGLLDAPELIYSVDGGRTWKTAVLELRQILAMKLLGAADAIFEGMAALPSLDAKILAKIRCPDRLGYITESPMRSYRC